MGMHKLTPAPGSTQTKRRLGRGPGSGTGGTAGRGEKGYYSRSGSVHKRGFEGGQMPLQRCDCFRGHVPVLNQLTDILNHTAHSHEHFMHG